MFLLNPSCTLMNIHITQKNRKTKWGKMRLYVVYAFMTCVSFTNNLWCYSFSASMDRMQSSTSKSEIRRIKTWQLAIPGHLDRKGMKEWTIFWDNLLLVKSLFFSVRGQLSLISVRKGLCINFILWCEETHLWSHETNSYFQLERQNRVIS